MPYVHTHESSASGQEPKAADGEKTLRVRITKAIAFVKVSAEEDHPVSLGFSLHLIRSGKSLSGSFIAQYRSTGAEQIEHKADHFGKILITLTITRNTNVKHWVDAVMNEIHAVAQENNDPGSQLLNHTEIDRVAPRIMEGDAWWEKMSREEQAEYLRQHPRSRKRASFKYNPTVTRMPAQPEADHTQREMGSIEKVARLIVGAPR